MYLVGSVGSIRQGYDELPGRLTIVVEMVLFEIS
jgi:hypothetical protein